MLPPIRIALHAAAGLLLGGCAAAEPTTAGAGGPRFESPFTVAATTIESAGRVFDARLYAPAPETATGAGVVLIGGGMSNDLDWSVPGFLEIDGERTQVTISGEGHADAPRLAKAFASRGAVVMHWSTIARDDPKRDRYPYEATLLTMDELVAQANAAIAAVRDVPGVDPDRIMLVGQSLGGYRAAGIAMTDVGVSGLVLIGSAQLARTGPEQPHRSVHDGPARERIAAHDANGDGALGRDEATDEDLAARFDAIDFDGDGVIRLWELAADAARTARAALSLSDEGPPARDDWGGSYWTEDVIVARAIPTLIVYGALDNAQARHAPIIAERIQSAGATHATLVVLPGLGHTMGLERDGHIGPFHETALVVIGSWFRTTGG